MELWIILHWKVNIGSRLLKSYWCYQWYVFAETLMLCIAIQTASYQIHQVFFLSSICKTANEIARCSSKRTAKWDCRIDFKKVQHMSFEVERLLVAVFSFTYMILVVQQSIYGIIYIMKMVMQLWIISCGFYVLLTV